MIVTTMKKRLEFDAGHRLVGHEGKCSNVHGHRYVVEVTCRPAGGFLDSVGRVVDFAVVKEVLGGWIDINLDHTFIANEKDDALIRAIGDVNVKPVYVVPFEPTAENLALFILRKAQLLLTPYGVVVPKLSIWETPTSMATVVDSLTVE